MDPRNYNQKPDFDALQNMDNVERGSWNSSHGPEGQVPYLPEAENRALWENRTDPSWLIGAALFALGMFIFHEIPAFIAGVIWAVLVKLYNGGLEMAHQAWTWASTFF